ncbi:MAG: hypothetical protein RL497_1054 [Pseudomonadota bacterium]|jgi:cytochrome b561
MPLKNTDKTYGWVAIVMHWVSAIVVLGLFFLGLWMSDLDYYHAWYKTAPDIHRSIGVVLIGFTLLRLLWRSVNIKPTELLDSPGWQLTLARVIHGLLYTWFFFMFVSGYLITTAKGQGLEVFNWFVIPALITGVENMEDTAGGVHLGLACGFMCLVFLHAGAALFHHFVKRDNTLRKMLGQTPK